MEFHGERPARFRQETSQDYSHAATTGFRIVLTPVPQSQFGFSTDECFLGEAHGQQPAAPPTQNILMKNIGTTTDAMITDQPPTTDIIPIHPTPVNGAKKNANSAREETVKTSVGPIVKEVDAQPTKTSEARSNTSKNTTHKDEKISTPKLGENSSSKAQKKSTNEGTANMAKEVPRSVSSEGLCCRCGGRRKRDPDLQRQVKSFSTNDCREGDKSLEPSAVPEALNEAEYKVDPGKKTVLSITVVASTEAVSAFVSATPDARVIRAVRSRAAESNGVQRTLQFKQEDCGGNEQPLKAEVNPPAAPAKRKRLFMLLLGLAVLAVSLLVASLLLLPDQAQRSELWRRLVAEDVRTTSPESNVTATGDGELQDQHTFTQSRLEDATEAASAMMSEPKLVVSTVWNRTSYDETLAPHEDVRSLRVNLDSS